ncbi:FtsX-like permease family protein [Streptomyces sp. MST-110588]|uniref:FtsX-like permease family protein n=1 Tax=Streptomyces sp. MST-110588 TaxID=2833628 RepID=UPI001F5C71F5|nr:FtsX-like permease family protein [Streptomyces sp. MST-110588]UNO38541.1 FtsX-like permease family protein [Streptomyces sp. MST-110588]
MTLALGWAAWSRYGHRSGPAAAVNGALALGLLLLAGIWLLSPALVRPLGAVCALPGRLLSRCSGGLAAANGAGAVRRVAAMAGPVLFAAGVSALLLCGNAASQAVSHAASQAVARTAADAPAHGRTSARGHVSAYGRVPVYAHTSAYGQVSAYGPARTGAGAPPPGARRAADPVKQRERNAVGMRVLMVPLALFSGAGILNTVVVATRRRRPEFAALRLAGATRGQLLRMLGWESLTVVLVGLVLAGAVAAGCLTGLAGRLSAPAGGGYPGSLWDVLPWLSLAKVVAGCAGLGLLGVLVPGFSSCAPAPYGRRGRTADRGDGTAVTGRPPVTCVRRRGRRGRCTRRTAGP